MLKIEDLQVQLTDALEKLKNAEIERDSTLAKNKELQTDLEKVTKIKDELFLKIPVIKEIQKEPETKKSFEKSFQDIFKIGE